MPINMPNNVTLRTVTFWYPATHRGISDWREPLTGMFDDELRPERRLLAAPQSHRDRALLVTPTHGNLVRCAGGPLRLIDIATTAARAAQEAAARHERWSATGRIGTRRPGRVESALLRAGRDTYVTYHSLRRMVGDALTVMATGTSLYPAHSSPQALLDHMHTATVRLADAAPDDMLITVAA